MSTNFQPRHSLTSLFPFLGATTSLIICFTHPEWSIAVQDFLLITPVILIVWRLLRVISQHSLSGAYWTEIALLTIGVQEDMSQRSNFDAKSVAPAGVVELADHRS